MQWKIDRKFLVFDIIAFETVTGKSSELWQEYWASALKELRNSPNISDVIKNNFPQIDLSQINVKVV